MKFNIPKEVKFILNELNKNNFEGYIVGGCVRDLILNIVPLDWDITTNALPADIINIFPKTFKTGLQHGTVTVVINNKNFEVTTYRIDGEYSDSRHPDEVIFTSSLIEDLSRRDFTINAMAYNELDEIIDKFSGTDDLNNKKIRAVGDANKRFNEDALRMLRAIRFACRLNFEIEEETFNGIKNNKSLISNISKERIRDELCKILLCKKPSHGFRLLESSGLLEIILPKLHNCVGFDQKNPHHHENVFDHIMSVLDNTEENLILRLAALFHDIGKPDTFTIDSRGIGHFYDHEKASENITLNIMKELKFDNKSIEEVTLLVSSHMRKYTQKESNYKLKKIINKIGVNNLDNFFKLQIADRIVHTDKNTESIVTTQKKINKIIKEKEPLTVKDLKVNGNDLISIGFKGKEIGELLNYLLDNVLKNPSLNNKDKLLELCKTWEK